MLGWESKSEQGICLSCHRAIDFDFRVAEDHSKLEAVAPTHVVATEKDAKNPRVVWFTLQKKCRCGTMLGWVVDLSPSAEAPPPA